MHLTIPYMYPANLYMCPTHPLMYPDNPYMFPITPYNSRMKILDGLSLESKLIPSGNDMDFRKFWHNMHGHIVFSKSWGTLQAYFSNSARNKNPPCLLILKLSETCFFFQTPPGIKISHDYYYLNFQKHCYFFPKSAWNKNPPGLLILKVSSLTHWSSCNLTPQRNHQLHVFAACGISMNIYFGQLSLYLKFLI